MLNKKIQILITYVCLSLAVLGIVTGTKGIVYTISEKKEIEAANKYIKTVKTTIKDSEQKAQEYIKKGDYDSAIKEYDKIESISININDNELIKKDKNALNQLVKNIAEEAKCDIKKAEIYALQGDKDKSSEILEQSLKETLETSTDINTKKSTDIKTNIKTNMMQAKTTYFTKISSKDTSELIVKLFLNGEQEKALQYSKKYFEINSDLSKYTKEDFCMIKTMFALYIINEDKDNAQKLLSNYETNTKRVSEYYDIAKMESMLGHYDIALNFLESSWEENKNIIEIYDYITELTLDKEVDISRMVLNLQAKDKENTTYKEWLAICYVNDGEYEQADKILKETDRSSILTSLLKIKTSILQNKYESAETQIDKLINTSTEERSEYAFMGYHLKGWLKLFNNQPAEALECYNKSVELNDSYTDNYTKLLPAILKQDNSLFNSLQITEVQKNIVNKPYEYMLYRILDKMTNDKNNYTNTVLELNCNASVFADLINDQIDKCDYSAALKYLNEYIEDKKNVSMNIQYLKSVLLFKTGEFDQAINLTRQFYTNNNNDYIALNNAACYYIIVEHNIDKALLNINAALDACTDNNKSAIDLNYRKLVELNHQYNITDNKSLDIPEMQLLY